MTETHKHYFKPVIDRSGGWEIISHYEACECGVTWTQWMMRRALDPAANARAAVALFRRGSRPWTGTRFPPKPERKDQP